MSSPPDPATSRNGPKDGCLSQLEGSERYPTDAGKGLQADDLTKNGLRNDLATDEAGSTPARSSMRSLTTEASRKAAMFQVADFAPPPAKTCHREKPHVGFIRDPTPQIDPDRECNGVRQTVRACSDLKGSADGASSGTTKTDAYTTPGKHESARKNGQIVDLTVPGEECEQLAAAHHNNSTNGSPSHVESSDDERSSTSRPSGREPSELREKYDKSENKDFPAPKTPLQPVRPAKVVKPSTILGQQAPTVPHTASGCRLGLRPPKRTYIVFYCTGIGNESQSREIFRLVCGILKQKI